MYGMKTNAMTAVGIQRLPAAMLSVQPGKIQKLGMIVWWKPLIERAVPSAIPSRTTGKAQIRSKNREMIQSEAPPK